MTVFQYVGLGVLIGRVETAAKMAVNQGAAHLVQEVAAAAPLDTGALRASIHSEGAKSTGTGVEAEVVTGAEVNEYAIPQHEGSAPHVIKPTTGKALMWPGAEHPVRQVNHPGNPATKYLERPLLDMAPAFKAYCAAAMRRVF